MGYKVQCVPLKLSGAEVKLEIASAANPHLHTIAELTCTAALLCRILSTTVLKCQLAFEERNAEMHLL